MDKHYLAGFFDGEGYVGQQSNRDAWVIVVPQKEPEVLEAIKEYWESLGVSRVRLYKTETVTRDNHLRSHIWKLHVWRGSDVEIILKDLLPYLIVKRAKAAEAIEWAMKKRSTIKILNVEDVVKLRRLGLGASKIALFYGVSGPRILKILNEQGITGKVKKKDIVNTAAAQLAINSTSTIPAASQS